MEDHHKTKAELIAELEALRTEVAALKLREQTISARKITQPFGQSPIGSEAAEVTGHTILLVDDSEVDRATYRRFLMQDRAQTYQIVEFDNGEEALQWCQQRIPDVYLIDYFLPDMDGLELLQQLKQQRGRDSLPVIMMTGQGNIQKAVELLKNGAQDYLEKREITAQSLDRAIKYIRQHNQLIQEQEWQQKRQQLLAKTALSIRESLKLEDILNTTVTEVRKILQCDRVIIYQIQPDGCGLVVIESIVDPALSILGQFIDKDCFNETWVEAYRQGRTRSIDDSYTVPDLTDCHREFLASIQVRANLVVPIQKNDGLWGLLIAHHCTAPRHWIPTEVELMRQLGIQVGIALQQAELLEQLQIELAERKQAELALQQLNTELEQRVAERTAELTEVNDRLLVTLMEKEHAYQLVAEQAQLLDLAHDSIITWDLNSVITFWNQGSESMYGWSKTEAFGQECHTFLKTKFPQPLAKIEAELLEKGYWEGELIHFNRDNQPVIVASRWVVQKDDGGRPIKLLEINNDISEKKRIEAALHQSEEQRRLALDLTHIGFWNWDIPTGKLIWNDNHFTLLGLAADGMEGNYQLWRSHVHPEDLGWVEQRFLESLENHTDYEAEYRVVHPDGSVHWLMGRAKAMYDESGKAVRSLGVLLDISDRKRAEETLRKYERIVSNTKDGIALLNCNYIYQIANEGYLSWCNKSANEVVGNSVRNILGQELFENFIQPRLDRCLAGEIIQYEKWFNYPNLVPQFLSVTYAPYRDGGENISGVIVSLRDVTKLKQAEEMLELQAAIARNMAEGICLVRADNGIFVHANPKFEQMFGYDPGELNGQHVSIVNYASESVNAQEVSQAIISTVLEKGEFSYEVHNVKKDGTPFWCSGICSVFRHPDYGDVILGVQQDITDRKLAQAALQQQTTQKQLRWSITQAIRQSLDLNTILNNAVTEVRQTLEVDRAAVYRFNPDWSGDFVVESVGRDWVKLVEPGICKVWQDTYLQETQGGRFRNQESFVVSDIHQAGLQPCHIELLEQFQAKAYAIVSIFSGENLWGLLAIYQNGKPRHWESWETELLEQIAGQLAIAIHQSELYLQLQNELQERKQTEATLREAERRWRFLLDNVQLLVIGIDQMGAVNYVNPFFLKLMGYRESEVLGKNWFENFVPDFDRQQVETNFSEILTFNSHPYYQNSIFTKSGENRFIAWNNTLLRDSAGNIIGTISIGEDITERQKIEKIKNEFISIVSHELRTPLTAIRAALGLLKTGIYDKKPDKFKRMIDIASIDSERLVRLVNDILDLERLQSGRATLEKVTCKAADLIQQAVHGIQAIANQQHLTLSVDPTDVEVWAASDSIIQVITNLLSNAIKFSPPDTTITVSVEPQTDYVLFQVSDQGRGIPADKLEAIFGRFQQVDASDSREKGGTGLGLAICRSIIEQHNGLIWAESNLGVGSTFFFTLPESVEDKDEQTSVNRG